MSGLSNHFRKIEKNSLQESTNSIKKSLNIKNKGENGINNENINLLKSNSINSETKLEKNSYKISKTEINSLKNIINLNNSFSKSYFKTENNSKNNLENKLKGTLENFNSIKKEIREVEFIPIDNNVSFLNENSFLNHSSQIKNSNNPQNQKIKELNIDLKNIFEKRNKSFEKEYNNFKDIIFFSKVLFNNKNQIIECELLLKENELYIFYMIDSLNNSLLYSMSDKDIILDNINYNDVNISKRNNKNDYNDILDEKKLILKQKKFNFSKPLFYLNFELMTCKVLIDKKTKWIKILILGTEENLKIFITNKDKYDKFIYLLNEQIFKSEGNKYNLLGLSLKKDPNFINHNFISLKEFESIAKTGDLLLFKSRFCTSKCQRILSCDNYDHIALIENKNGVISLYQSTSNSDINFFFWDLILFNSYHLEFDRITYRRLNIEAENEDELINIQKDIEKKFDEFVKETKNKKYFLSISIL